MAEPQNLQFLDELRFKSGKKIIPRLGFRNEIALAIDRHYGIQTPEPASPLAPLASSLEDEGIEFISFSDQQRNIAAMREMEAELLQKSKATPAVQIVASVIRAAVAKKASDIHVEPQSSETSIRLRIDGILREHQRIPRALQNPVASRIKILSDMDIAERRVPQDGRFLVKIVGKRLDLRVSTLPTQYGEKVVMRLLETDAPMQDFSSLGFPEGMGAQLKQMLSLPQGTILVTGPTGSGNTKAGLTFASCLRSILRQDPNVIMVGEIRDGETADIALKAAQTGHLVLSTLHTNDSISAITRLLDLEIPAFHIAASMTGIIAQRLIRRLCSCRKPTPVTSEFTARLLQNGVTSPPQERYTAIGCDDCDLTGYRGRIGIYEMLVLDDSIRSAIRDGGRADTIRALARANGGMRLMHEYALEHVLHGLTTLEEVQRVVPLEKAAAVNCGSCLREVSPTFAFCPYCGEKRVAHETSSQPHPAVELGVHQ